MPLVIYALGDGHTHARACTHTHSRAHANTHIHMKVISSNQAHTSLRFSSITHALKNLPSSRRASPIIIQLLQFYSPRNSRFDGPNH